MSKGFSATINEAASAVKQQSATPNNEGCKTGSQTAETTQERAAASALTTNDSLKQKAASGAAKLAKVQKASKEVQIKDAVLQGRADARDSALAYAAGNLDEATLAMTEVVLQLQAGKKKIASATDEELIAFVEAEIDESDLEVSLGNLRLYSARNGEGTQSLNLLEGVF